MSLINNSNKNSKGLLLVGDTISKTVNKNDESNSLLFGDAVAATLIENKKNKKNIFILGSGSQGFDKLMLKNSGFNKKKILMKPEFFMDGKEVFSFAINKVPKLINEIIRRSKIKNINYYILHQANKMMLNKILDMSKVKENKRLFSIKNFGNTSSASIPVTISKNLNNKKDKKMSLLAGFGAGFSYAACITDSTKTKILKIIKK